MDDYRGFINRQLPRRERACETKARFVSRREANNLMRHGRMTKGPMKPYHCPYCNGWHLGHRRGRRQSRESI